MSARVLVATLAAALVATASSDAKAWYFPEHVVLAKDATSELAPDVRDVLRRAIDRARGDGLPALCPVLDVGLEDLSPTKPLRTRMLSADLGVDCVPYAALAAIAADHANDSIELRTVITSKKGLELTTAAAYEWRRFLEATERYPAARLERMAFVHELDVDFYFIDPGYELRAQATHAHFVDAGRTVDEVVQNAARVGALDNGVAQVLAHHVRSLQLASRGQVAEAILEHGFAVHFLEDAFSAGHLVMTDRTWAGGNAGVRARHDYFDAHGLRVRRATSVEPCAALEKSFEVDLPACWTTTGDGSLGVAADSSERVHVVRAVKKLEIELAMALEPARMVAFAEGLGEREQVAFGELFDPLPWWTVPRKDRRRSPSTAAHAVALVRGAAAAIADLRDRTTIRRVLVGEPPSGPLLPEDVIATALEPCVTSTTHGDDCGEGRDVAVGTIGASLLRPLLVELPAAEDDPSKLQGEAPLDHGVAFQLFAAASTVALIAPRSPVDFFAPMLGGSMGLAYRFGTYLPGRRNRSAVEVNLGLSEALHYDTRGDAGGKAVVTVLDQELRFPILWEGLTSYVLPFDLGASHDAGSLILFGGVRVRELLTNPAPRLWAVELEAAAFALSRGQGSYPLYAASPEVRVYLGLADPSAAQPSLPARWAPTLGLSFTGGYATFL